MKSIRLTTIAALCTLSAACALTPPRHLALEDARRAVEEARANPDVAQRAQLELDRAVKTLNAAEQRWRDDRDDRTVNHLAYLAQREAAIAQEVAKLRTAEQSIQQARAERERALLDVRAAEAARARAQADTAQRRAEVVSEQAAISEARAREAAREREAAQERAARLEAAMRDMAAKQTERGMVVTLGDVLFDVGKADLRPNAMRAIDKLAEFMRQNPERRVSIEGHTDSTGGTDFNLALSQMRANAVRDALVARGISADRILARGLGEDMPVASNDSTSGRAQNRRVEVVISDESGRIAAR